MEKQLKEPHWTRDEKDKREQKEGELETGEKNALVLFGIMFSEIREGDDILDRLAEIFLEIEESDPFQTSFGAAFRKERESIKQK